MSTPAYMLHTDDAARLTELVAQLARELGQPASVSVSLDTPLLERLGIDSLGRMELALRIEQTFRVRLPDEAALLAATPRALLAAIEAAASGAGNATLRASARAAPAPATGRAIDPPTAANTLVDVLAWHVERWPERVHLTLLEGDQAHKITYGELDRRARAAAAGLGARGVGPGARVALMLPTGQDYFACFLGVLLTGAVPVPIYPPARLDAIEEHLRRQSAILANAGVSALIAPRIAAFAGPLLKQGVPSLEHFVAAEDLREFASNDPQAPPVFPLPEDVALLQYTSGSTSLPKGVVLTHANLLANIRGIGHSFGLTADDVVVTWLPLYHDMGLDRRLAVVAVSRFSRSGARAPGLPRAAAALAAGDPRLPRHDFAGTQLRLRDLRQPPAGGSPRRAGSELLAPCAERRGAGQPADDQPL